jgi:hypothetical protein
MPLVSPTARRRADFEVMEPRLMFAGDGAVRLAAAPAGPGDMEMYLPGSISGSVFAASHAEGVRQAGDAGIGGVRIELLSAAGEVLAEAITGETGDYEFPALNPGIYALRQIQPAGWLDGFGLTGTGGGPSPAPNVITQIVVQPGALLAGYDFAEIAAPVQAARQAGEAPSLIGFLPPLTVSWSRPAEISAPPSIEPTALRSLQSLPPEPRPVEPIFGGSSRVLDEQDAALEAFTSEDEADEKVARQSNDAGSDASSEQRARQGERLAVRDLAFESDDIAVQDESVDGSEAEEEVTPSTGPPVVARRSAATSEAAKKPAA